MTRALAWPDVQPTITLGVGTLRPFRLTDVAAIYDPCSDPEMQRWLPVPDPWTVSAATEYVTAYASTWWEARRGAVFALVDHDDACVGSFDLNHLNLTARSGELGYWLAPAARGRGLATLAALALVDWAFAQAELQRIELRVDPENAASRNLITRIGAKQEGLLREVYVDRQGLRRDKLIFSLHAAPATPKLE